MQSIPGLAKRLPLTSGLIVVTIAAGVTTGVLGARFHRGLLTAVGWDQAALRGWQLHRLWASLPFGSVPGLRPTMVLLLALGPGLLEWRRGTRVAALTFFIAGPTLTLATTLGLWFVYTGGFDSARRFLYTPDLGSSTASLACWGAVTGLGDGAAHALLAVSTLAVLIVLWTISPEPYVVDHAVAFVGSFAIGASWRALRARSGPK